MDLFEHIYSVGEWGASFRCSEVLLELFKKRNIIIGHCTPRAAAPDRNIQFDAMVQLEPYTSFPESISNFYSQGAFTYCLTADLPKGLRVGRYCSIAPGLRIAGERHPIEWASSSAVTYDANYRFFNDAHDAFNARTFVAAIPDTEIMHLPVIGNDVWIAQDVLIKRRIKIGTGAVVAAGSVVTEDVEPYMIVGGNPARPIRARFEHKVAERLLASEWWQYGPDIFKVCDFKNPERFLDDLETVIALRRIKPFAPHPVGFRDILNDIMSAG